MTINDKKAEILDIIMQQEQVKNHFTQLDQLKQQKFAELQELLKENENQQNVLATEPIVVRDAV